MPIERSAGAVIFRKEPSFAKATKGKKGTIKYLLLYYPKGSRKPNPYWDFPKGHIEKGEKPEEAARREAEEETGIKDIEFIPGFKETIKYFYKREGKNFFKIVIFFLAKTRTKEVKISWEHKGFKWLPHEEALGQLTFKNAREILKKADDFFGKSSKSAATGMDKKAKLDY